MDARRGRGDAGGRTWALCWTLSWTMGEIASSRSVSMLIVFGKNTGGWRAVWCDMRGWVGGWFATVLF